jgi:hypothetical protein
MTKYFLTWCLLLWVVNQFVYVIVPQLAAKTSAYIGQPMSDHLEITLESIPFFIDSVYLLFTDRSVISPNFSLWYMLFILLRSLNQH